MAPAGGGALTKPTRNTEQEISDLENWTATINDYLDDLDWLARRAQSEAELRSIALKQRAQLRRLSSLQARRRALQRLLSPKE